MRYVTVTRAAGELMNTERCIFSPITHSHPVALTMAGGQDLDFWLKQDENFLRWMDELWILCLPGWKDSKGVAAEEAFAETWDIPIRYVDPVTLGVGEEP